MDDRHGAPPGAHDHRIDHEIDATAVARYGVILVVTCVVSFVFVLFLTTAGRDWLDSKDPAPSPVEEANVRRLPPEPRLQRLPNRDMDLLRAENEKTLASYAWVDPVAGTARIPIDRAIEIVAEKGLPQPPAPAAPAPAAKPAAAPAKGGAR